MSFPLLEVYAVVNFKRCEVLTAMRKEDNDKNERMIYKDRVFLGCPESLTAIVTPFSQIIKYDIVWNIPIQGRKLNLENVTVDEILALSSFLIAVRTSHLLKFTTA